MLYIGCRVRIIYSINWPELGGTEGTIIDRTPPDHDEDAGDWIVSADMWGGAKSPDGLWFFSPASDQLEPILLDEVKEKQREEELEYV